MAGKMAANVNEQFIKNIDCAFATGIDESIDVSGMTHLAVFIHACCRSMNITEELLTFLYIIQQPVMVLSRKKTVFWKSIVIH